MLLRIIGESAGSVAESSSLLSGWLRVRLPSGESPTCSGWDPGATVLEVVNRIMETPSSSGAVLQFQGDDQGIHSMFRSVMASNRPQQPGQNRHGNIRRGRDKVRVSVQAAAGSGQCRWRAAAGHSCGGVQDLFKGRKGAIPGQPIPATALDLPLAKTLTETMGGTITVFSSRDQGNPLHLRFKSR